MGNIYLAELAPQGIRVVVKSLQETHTSDERYVEMFQNEAALMSQLEHPNIVKVLGTPVIDGKLCLVMEFVRGRNLQQVMRRLRDLGRRFPPMMAIHIMRKVLLGLHEAHQVRDAEGHLLELVHRDVKPGNVLISYAGDVKITDFGIAKSSMQNRMTTAGVVKGTVCYLSPEQIKSEKISARSDLFACASMLVEILTDRRLFDRGPVAPTLMAILSGDRAPVSQLLPFRAPELAEVLEKGLALKAEDRFQTGKEFAQALGAAGRALGAPVADDEVGAMLRQVFQGAGASTLGPEEAIREDVTYLVQKEEQSSGRMRPPSKVPGARGSEPLDASSFGPPPLPPSDGVPREAVEADRRAAAMLDDGIVFDAPVEVEEDDELDFDELEPEELDFELNAEVSAAALLQGVAGRPEPKTDPLRTPPLQMADEIPSAAFGLAPPAPAQSVSVPLGGRSNSQPVDGWVQITPAMSGQWIPAGSSSDHPAEPRPGAQRRARILLLAGCLAGVALTAAVLLAAGA